MAQGTSEIGKRLTAVWALRTVHMPNNICCWKDGRQSPQALFGVLVDDDDGVVMLPRGWYSTAAPGLFVKPGRACKPRAKKMSFGRKVARRVRARRVP